MKKEEEKYANVNFVFSFISFWCCLFYIHAQKKTRDEDEKEEERDRKGVNKSKKKSTTTTTSHYDSFLVFLIYTLESSCPSIRRRRRRRRKGKVVNGFQYLSSDDMKRQRKWRRRKEKLFKNDEKSFKIRIITKRRTEYSCFVMRAIIFVDEQIFRFVSTWSFTISSAYFLRPEMEQIEVLIHLKHEVKSLVLLVMVEMEEMCEKQMKD